jgi:hypothetical protein
MNSVLKKVSKAHEFYQPVGFKVNKIFDYWIHAEFVYDSSCTSVVVLGWSVTDGLGKVLEVSDMPLEHAVFVLNALDEDVQAHIKYYYDELEAEHMLSHKIPVSQRGY